VTSKPKSDAYKLDDQVGFLMRKANQRHLAIFGKLIPSLTPMQFATCSKLRELGAVSQNDLGRQTAMDAATIKGVIDRLVDQGLVERRRDPNDQRRRAVSLTEAGVRAYDALVDAAAAVTAQTLTPLSPTEQARFLALLRKLAP